MLDAPGTGASADHGARACSCCAEMARYAPPRPGALELIARLRGGGDPDGAGLQLAARCSSTARWRARRSTRRTFAAILTADVVDATPSPRPRSTSPPARRSAREPARTLVLEDSPTGVAAARGRRLLHDRACRRSRGSTSRRRRSSSTRSPRPRSRGRLACDAERLGLPSRAPRSRTRRARRTGRRAASAELCSSSRLTAAANDGCLSFLRTDLGARPWMPSGRTIAQATMKPAQLVDGVQRALERRSRARRRDSRRGRRSRGPSPAARRGARARP